MEEQIMKTNVNNSENGKQINLNKRLTFIMALLLLSFTINAQGLFSQYKTPTSINVFAMTVNTHSYSSFLPFTNRTNLYLTQAAEDSIDSDKMEKMDSFINNLHVETDAELEVEGWMIDESYFNYHVKIMEVDIEETMEIEDWMTNEETFFKNLAIEPDKDDELKVENWMVDSNYWNW